MRSWSIPAGKFFGAKVRIHLTFLLLLIYVWSTETYNHPVADWWRALALVGIIFGAVVLHELGHALGLLHNGGGAGRSLVLMPIGSVTLLEENEATLEEGRELRMTLGGAGLNLLLAVMVAGIVIGLPQVQLFSKPLITSYNLPRTVVWVNVLLAALNLIPAYPLDGGRILRAAFARRMDTVRATRRAVAVSQAFAMVFIFAGLWENALMLLGLFVFVAAQLEERSVVFQSVLEKVRMEDVMLTDFSTLSPADTLEDALSKAVHSLQDDFPVIRGSDMVGVVSRQKIMEALRAQGNGYVQAVMNRVGHVADRSESLSTAFRRISAQGLTIIPVVDSGRLVGIVTLQNLMHSMSLLAQSKKLRREIRVNEE